MADPTPCHAIQSAWGDRHLRERHFIRNVYGSGWCVHRSWFDSLLAECAREIGSVVVTQARPLHLSRRCGEWRVDVATPSGNFTVRSEFLVDASGAGASLARMLGARRTTFDRMVGLSRLFPSCHSSDRSDPVLLLETHPLGWWYSIQTRSDALLVTLVLGGSDLRGKLAARERAWNLALAGTRETRRRIERSGAPEGLHARAATLGRLDRAAGEGWLAVGDAASTLDPLSGSGIRKALIEAERAATAIRQALCGNTDALSSYASGIASAFGRHLRRREEYYARERQWSNSTFWSERARQAAATSTHDIS